MHYPYPFKCFFIIPRVPILKGGLVLLRTHWHLAPGKLNCNFVRGFPVCLIPVSLFFFCLGISTIECGILGPTRGPGVVFGQKP